MLFDLSELVLSKLMPCLGDILSFSHSERLTVGRFVHEGLLQLQTCTRCTVCILNMQ